MRFSWSTIAFTLAALPSVALAQASGAAGTTAAPGSAAASSGGAPAPAAAATPSTAAPPPAAAPPAEASEAPAAAEPALADAAADAPASDVLASDAAPTDEATAEAEPARIVYVKVPVEKVEKPSNESTPVRVDPWKVPWTHHVSHVYLNAFVGALFTPDSTYDLFSDGDASVVLGARVGVPLFAVDHTGLSLTADWFMANQEGSARAISTRLGQQRVGLGLELRHLFMPTVGAYARLSAGAAYLDSRLGEQGTAGALYDDSWEFQAAGVLGGSLLLAGDRDGRKRSARLYLTAEAGYTFVAETALSYLPGDSGPPRAEPFVLDGLYLGGPIATLGLAIGY